MASDASRERINSVVSDLRQLHPRFDHLISRLSEAIAQLETSTAAAAELKYSRNYLVKVAYRNAFIRLRLILDNNFIFIETLGLLAEARYVFELLVWLRVLDRDSRYSLVFFAQVIDKQIQHLEGHKKKVESEILLFESLDQEESKRIRDAVHHVLENRSGGPQKTAEKVAAAGRTLMSEIDRKARRSLSLYADEAKRNGYGFQAYLLRQNGLQQIHDQINELKTEREAFRSSCPIEIRRLVNRRWIWKEQAESVGMLAQYEFLYSYTSRLLHATPVSIWADQKNLEPQEVRTFLEYVYVSMLDALELGEREC